MNLADQPLPVRPSRADVATKIAARDWPSITDQINSRSYGVLKSLLTQSQCTTLAEYYRTDSSFRSRVVMANHGFGRGEYQYFAYPLPPLVAELRTALYPRLAKIANSWSETLNSDVHYPAAHQDFLEQCHNAGQTKPTPLLLQYEAGDFNCLHQDLYGEHVFPLQVVFLLSTPGAAFSGGEFVLTEQRPRMQSRVEVVPLDRGDGVVFPVNYRPAQGKRGAYRVNVRHGVSRLHSGHRQTLGVIFHDAQ